MNEKDILIVEDDEITALNLKISLQKQNYNVVGISYDIRDAKQKIFDLKPEIIIIDISLQDSHDGIELAKEVRDIHGIPFIFLTSYTDDDIISQAKLTEPYGYIENHLTQIHFMLLCRWLFLNIIQNKHLKRR